MSERPEPQVPHNRFSYARPPITRRVLRPADFEVREVDGRMLGTRLGAWAMALFGPADVGGHPTNAYRQKLVGTRYDPDYRQAVRAEQRARRSG